MKVFAVLCLAAVAFAKPEGYPYETQAGIATVTERTYTIRPEVQKYYGGQSFGGQSYGGQSYGGQGYSSQGYSGQSYGGQGYGQAGLSYSAGSYAAPAVHQHQQSYAVQSASVAPAAYAYHAVSPVVHTVHSVATPAVAYQQYQQHAVQAAAPVYHQANVRYGGGYENQYGNQYQGETQAQYAQGQEYSQGYAQQGETKVYKHVYAFAAPEEPSQRARIVIKAPATNRKHYKLVFIKTPSQQTIVDSDITLPAHDEEKTLIYVLSKNQKQLQPEIRIKQAESSKHGKPEVFFLKYKNEAEAQAIASGAISGQTSGIPANAELISDGSVSVLGQGGSGSASGSESSFVQSGYSTGLSGLVGGASQYSGGASQYTGGASQYSGGLSSGASQYSGGISQYSTGSVGVVPTMLPAVVSTVVSTTPAVPVYPAVSSIGRSAVVNIAEGTGAGLSRGFSADFDSGFARSADSSVQIES